MKISLRNICLPLLFTFLLLLSIFSCVPNNGLPNDLRNLLKDHGIELNEVSSNAPIRSRKGFIVANHSPMQLTKIRQEFGLVKNEDNTQKSYCLQGVKAIPTEVWSVLGRPPVLKLKNGAQFQYMCIVVTSDGKMYVIAEYAYG